MRFLEFHSLPRSIKTATVLVCWACLSYAPTHAQMPIDSTKEKPIAEDEFFRQIRKPGIVANVRDYAQEIRRRKISFLPAIELKKADEDTNVPDEIRNALRDSVILYLQVSRFECRRCLSNSQDGDSFSKVVLEEVIRKIGIKTENNPLFGQPYSAEIGPIGGVDKSEFAKVHILINGTLEKTNQGYHATVILAYLYPNKVGKHYLASETWIVSKSNWQVSGQKIVNWIANSLNSAIR